MKHKLEGAVVEDVEIMEDPGGGDKRIFALYLVKDGKRFIVRGNNGLVSEPVQLPPALPRCIICGEPINPHDAVYDGRCSSCRRRHGSV